MEELFTCKDCGSHDLIVEHEYTAEEEFTHTLPCDCDSNKEIAASYTIEVQTQMHEWGPLDELHHWTYDEREALDTQREQSDVEIECHECYSNAREQDWEADGNDMEDAPEVDHEFWVRCGGCEREIEFGWSHPDRGGRIWPAECTDFNPWKSWPEPGYAESWRKKGWLRPARQKQCA